MEGEDGEGESESDSEGVSRALALDLLGAAGLALELWAPLVADAVDLRWATAVLPAATVRIVIGWRVGCPPDTSSSSSTTEMESAVSDWSSAAAGVLLLLVLAPVVVSARLLVFLLIPTPLILRPVAEFCSCNWRCTLGLP
jgi:hypothetical protein